MKMLFWNVLVFTSRVWEILLAPFIFMGALVFLLIRKIGVYRMPVSRKIFYTLGFFPLRDHYYEPMFNPKHLKKSLREDRYLPGIKFNDEEQLEILNKFDYNEELKNIPFHKEGGELDYHYKNGSFEMGDGEYWYSIIRLKKPKRIIEVGSGHSTKMAMIAIKKNKEEDPNYNCEVICIEPYEMPWLEKLDVKVIRGLVENQEHSFFDQLEENDILFIDSSHVIRPQGDVNFEFLELIPGLNKGVIVHIHDIFTPKNYLDSWVIDQVRLWDEQYLLEAFLSNNDEFKIIGATNYLKYHYPEQYFAKNPVLKEHSDYEPRSFYIQRAK